MYSQLGLLLFGMGAPLCSLLLSNERSEFDIASDIAIRVNAILSDYVDLENDFFEVSPRRIILFEAMDFDGFSKKLESLVRGLEQSDLDVRRQQPVRADVRAFNTAMSDYIRRLRAAMHALQEISTRLAEKARAPEKYSWKEYKSDTDRYKRLRTDYSTAGATLNRLFRQMQK